MLFPLAHPDLDLITIVSLVAPCIYYGIKQGVKEGMKKKKKVTLPLHPMRRQGDKYAYYFYLAYCYVGPDSFLSRIPRIGAISTGILATVALKMIVTKGEQYKVWEHLQSHRNQNARNVK